MPRVSLMLKPWIKALMKVASRIKVPGEDS